MKNLVAVVALGLFALLLSCASDSPPLATEAGASNLAARHNAEGIEHYNMGHWSEAKKHFEAAVDADPSLAEPHYNLALALDKLGSHAEATTHFKKAGALDAKVKTYGPYQGHAAPPAGMDRNSGVDRMGY
jgi:Tfp pilus assembly protein PilF